MKVMINTFAKFVERYQRQQALLQDIGSGALDELVVRIPLSE